MYLMKDSDFCAYIMLLILKGAAYQLKFKIVVFYNELKDTKYIWHMDLFYFLISWTQCLFYLYLSTHPHA